jgi:hypothetical protein
MLLSFYGNNPTTEAVRDEGKQFFALTPDPSPPPWERGVGRGRFFGPNPSDSPSLTGKGRVRTQAITEFPLPASGRGSGGWVKCQITVS